MIAVLVLLQLMWIQPDAQRTPGKVNPDITQGNIADNICSNKWSTGQIRPLSDYTRDLKLDQMQQYRDTIPDEAERCVPRSNNPKCYEEDHLISLQAGGHPNVHEKYELDCWSRKFRVTPDELRDTVKRVGTSQEAIERELQRST